MENNDMENDMDDRLDEMVNEKLDKLTSNEIDSIGKSAKFARKFLAVVSYFYGLCMLVTCILGFVQGKLETGLGGLLATIILFVIPPNTFCRKSEINKDNRYFAYKKIRNEIKKQSFNKGKEIKSVVIIDSFTEFSDKLHAILNYQEIIQTRYYKFQVTYTDNTVEIITTKDGSAKYRKLIQYLNKATSGQTSINDKEHISQADELRKYKTLLDDKIITEEEYEEKKKQLLGK